MSKGWVYKLVLAVCCTLTGVQDGYAQIPAFNHRRNPGLRYEVDAKRTGTDPNSNDALPRSREFKRIDSSYYVGWMYEGFYKYNHAADYPGFRNAAAPLEQTLRLMERDYRKELATRTSDLISYFPVYKFQMDYTLTAYYLMNCYSNMDEPDRIFALLRRTLSLNFQRDYYMDAYNYLGWTVHRNRFYTSAKYPFLKNSIDENEQLAHRYLDSGMRRINRNMALNSLIFQPGYERAEKLAVYHYKSILHSYAFHTDSAAYYYGLMRDAGVLPHNNYATFRVTCGDFRTADAEYTIESQNTNTDKRLQEWAYYLPILYTYKGQTKKGITMSKDMIQANGSTPGFGWYNIAVARCLLYDGQYEEANRYINRAAEFKELHIGTTLGQTHYDFSIQLLKLMQKIDQYEAQRFEDRNWWYHPERMGKMAQYLGEKYLQQFLIINQFSQNPERDRVVYRLFSTESTVSWDEVWFLIRDFSTPFFLDRFRQQLSTDDRKLVLHYYKYFIARLQMRSNNYKEAALLLNEVLLDPTIDTDYEKLLIARTLQAQAECAKELDDEASYKERLYLMYSYYPQLVPYSGMRISMRVLANGNVDKALQDRLRECNIDWTTDENAPLVQLHFSAAGDKKKVDLSVTTASGRQIVVPQSFTYKDPLKGAVQLAYRLFDIGGKGTEKDTMSSAL
jgi:hypothetical protein